MWPPLCTEALEVQSPRFCPKLVASEAWALVTDPQGPPLLSRCSLLCAHSSGSLAGPMPITAHQEVGCPSCVWAGTQEALRPGSPQPMEEGARQTRFPASKAYCFLSCGRATLWLTCQLRDPPCGFQAAGCPSPWPEGAVCTRCSQCPCWNYLSYCGAFDGSAPGLPWKVCDRRQRAGLAQKQGLWPWEGRRPGICHRHVKGK